VHSFIRGDVSVHAGWFVLHEVNLEMRELLSELAAYARTLKSHCVRSCSSLMLALISALLSYSDSQARSRRSSHLGWDCSPCSSNSDTGV
jgi:hypothetical protein